MVQQRQSVWPPRPGSGGGDAGELPALPTVADREPVGAQENGPEAEGSWDEWDNSPTQVEWILPVGPAFDDLEDEDAPDTIPTPPPDPE